MSENRNRPLLTILFTFGACHAFAEAQGPSQEELTNAVNDNANWLYVDHDYHGTRYSSLDQINTNNVGQLSKVCHTSSRNTRRLRRPPSNRPGSGNSSKK